MDLRALLDFSILNAFGESSVCLLAATSKHEIKYTKY